ncbi:MAG TPA: NAD(P)/FAD-dependent oxidoreductase [Streptosporangiaceae bacterium]|nr:NAD(P)/FAD-dependent oxidoreductase [Streptosporangiaceae bacterium]
MRVVVIGGGFAGLMAADRIARSGQQPVVLEARNRVGGRIWSQELLPGDPRTVVERGGEFVLDGYDVMRSVLKDLGLALADTTMSYYSREPRGASPTTAAEVAHCARLVEAAAASAAPTTSLADLITEDLPGLAADKPAAVEAYISRVTATHGVDSDVLAAASLADVTSSYDSRPTWRVAGGNQLLAIGLANRLGDAVHRNTPVRAIEHSLTGVRVLTDTGELTADAAIVTVPMAILRTLRFDPPLPARYQQAWQRAGLAHNAKLHLPLTAPADPSAVLSVPDRFWTWTATDDSGQVQPVLHAFGGTATALAALGVSHGPQTWAARAAALRPELALDLTGALLTTWNDDRWAGESYSAHTVSVEPGDDELIAQPTGRIYFAGEHTAGDWAGLMEGALRSGVRAADEVLALTARPANFHLSLIGAHLSLVRDDFPSVTPTYP